MLAALTALAPLSMDIYAPSMLAMRDDFRAPEWLIQATITGCLLGIGIGQIVWGPLSDRIGRRPVILVGGIGWTIASALSAITANAEMLVAVRFVAGLLGAACIVAARSVVRDITPDVRQRAARIGILSIVGAAAPIVAPIAGAAIAAVWGWRADFIALTIIGAVITLAFAVMVPETIPEEERANASGGIVAGLATALRDRELLSISIALACFSFAFFAYVATAAFIVEGERGYPPSAFAVVFAANAAVMVLSTLLYRRLARRYPARSLMGVGLAGGVIAGLALLLAVRTGSPDSVLWIASMLLMASSGFAMPAAHGAGQSLLVASGAASALTGASQFLGGVLGSPVTGAIGTTSGVLSVIIIVASAAGLAAWWVIPRDPRSRRRRTR
ncbi:Bcr/CflA family efflux MFS transporter [Microbacterium sp. No. 7]|uniref:Bcr/CflA family efflux MFS transporter n=1 Tax=Microbacterium sp. No. 7 TaxID=1714373 RepID=UPI0006D264DC|nr:Bcr/CflA family efflux MFS transporter [Microbacterium sp. No. 7]ALJ21403.1 hypothetical protein AOA12_16470 [Microbacterium sp. No. 7]